jgi:hypothetical protein
MMPTQTDLFPQHLKLIKESDISPEVASERGYQSITIKADLKRLGFTDHQCRVPALLHPVWDVRGETASYQARPDQPRINRKTGKPIKYETPSGSRMLIDVPPRIRGELGDPKVPLFITEGIRKADSAVSKGLVCIDILGVWNWRGSNEYGGKTALPDWECIALEDRKVYLAFDSDVMEKPAVYQALARLEGFLSHRGAKVLFIYLSPGKNGTKIGLDDFFADGGTVQALLSQVSTELRGYSPPDRENSGPYLIDQGRHCYQKQTSNGSLVVPLCNFKAHIASEVVEDDGIETQKYFKIKGISANGKKLPDALVPARQFSNMSWVMPSWGVKAVVAAGQNNKDRLREAIQLNSPDVSEERVWTHTGFREIDGSLIYLHGGGGLGADGPVAGVTVELEASLHSFRLPDPPSQKELTVAIKASLDLLALAKDSIAVPLLAAAYRTPLNHFLRSDFSLYLAGLTGVFKTELAALLQGHFGREFDRSNLPGNFRSTANFLERLGFLAKDSIVTVDDFAPSGTSFDISRYHQKADHLLRGAGNQSGRGRLRADGLSRPTFRPRCIFVSTGEDIPRGSSLRSRTLIIELAAGDIDTDMLTEIQGARDVGLLAASMSGFLKWVLLRLDELVLPILGTKERLRQAASNASQHRRSPDIVANLALGWRLLLEFACESGALTIAEQQELWGRGWQALLEASEAQSNHQEDENPCVRFMSLLAAALTNGQAHLTDKSTGLQPKTPLVWGWRREPGGFTNEWVPRGSHIGWLEDEDIYLEPDATFAVVQNLARSQGEAIPVTKNTLWKRLKESGRLTSYLPNRNVARVTIQDRRRYVIHLHSATILTLAESETSETKASALQKPTLTERVAEAPVLDIGKDCLPNHSEQKGNSCVDTDNNPTSSDEEFDEDEWLSTPEGPAKYYGPLKDGRPMVVLKRDLDTNPHSITPRTFERWEVKSMVRSNRKG